MKALLCITAALCCGFQMSGGTAAQPASITPVPKADRTELPVARVPADASGSVRFAAYDVYLDTGESSLAAYQLDIRATAGTVRIAGIEGGEHAAFRKPPYYDPKAIQRERVILAAFSTAAPEALPKGKTRVATLHVQIEGTLSPKFNAKLETASPSGADGRSITVTISERKE